MGVRRPRDEMGRCKGGLRLVVDRTRSFLTLSSVESICLACHYPSKRSDRRQAAQSNVLRGWGSEIPKASSSALLGRSSWPLIPQTMVPAQELNKATPTGLLRAVARSLLNQQVPDDRPEGLSNACGRSPCQRLCSTCRWMRRNGYL